ncbi:Conserved_hypothetical protein [Hexamita inflata]|uniref:Uncharacterized protein n=1 Tax=Hexamita inflata TaxID=28002 RepID=A0AA86RI47_9EUKA|nr:Conserved hypothetical protein [Hexamita inflata]
MSLEQDYEQKCQEIARLREQRVKETEIVRQKFTDQKRIFEAQRDEIVQSHELQLSNLREQLKQQQLNNKALEQANKQLKANSEHKINHLKQTNTTLKETVQKQQDLLLQTKKLARIELVKQQTLSEHTLKTTTEDYNQKLKELNSELQKLRSDETASEVEGLKSQLALLVKQNNEQRNTILTHKSEVEGLKTKITDLTVRYNQLQEKMLEKVNVTPAQQIHIQSMMDKMNKLNKQNEDIKLKYEEVNKEKELLEKKVEQLRFSQDLLRKSKVDL